MFRVPLALTCVVSGAAFGQQTPLPIDSLGRGSEIRVWSREPALNGWKLQYLGRTDTSAVVAERRGSARVVGFRNEMPFRVIDRIDVNAGREYNEGNRFLLKTLKGGGIGLLTGVALAATLIASDRQNEGSIYAIVVLPQAGAFIGSLVGAVNGLRGNTKWRPVDIWGDQIGR
jgi:hypothetical protein